MAATGPTEKGSVTIGWITLFEVRRTEIIMYAHPRKKMTTPPLEKENTCNKLKKYIYPCQPLENRS